MEDGVDASQQLAQVKLQKVPADEGEIPVGQLGLEVALLHPAGIVIGEAVDSGDFVAVPEQAAAQVGSDETRGAGHEAFHGRPCLRKISWT